MAGAVRWLLAVESATEAASVALLRGGEVVATRVGAAGRPASETLLPAILALLAEHGVAVGEVDAFAVSIGPGSFTGLRVGVATVKGLAFGSHARVAAVPTLAALALRAGPRAGPVVAVLDARRGEVYAAAQRGDDPLAAPLWGPLVLTPEGLAARIEAGALVIGEGVAVVADALAARFGGGVRLVAPPEGAPDAGAVGRLGARLLAAGRGLPAAEIAPAYIRRAEAEVRRTGARFEAPDAL